MESKATLGRIERLSAIIDTLGESLGCTPDEAIDRIELLARLTAPTSQSGPRTIRALQRVRARRNEWLGVDLFRDPAWDMLLDLVLAHREQRTLSISALCFASGVPQTTALRHIDRMVECGVIVRYGDFADHRRVLVALAPASLPRIEAMFTEMRIAFGVTALFGEAAATEFPQPVEPGAEA